LDETNPIKVVTKKIGSQTFTGLRIYLYLPVTCDGEQVRGPFMHRPGDDDSSAVTLWGTEDLRTIFRKALGALDEHYSGSS
jgi:hypothetical protein